MDRSCRFFDGLDRSGEREEERKRGGRLLLRNKCNLIRYWGHKDGGEVPRRNFDRREKNDTKNINFASSDHPSSHLRIPHSIS